MQFLEIDDFAHDVDEAEAIDQVRRYINPMHNNRNKNNRDIFYTPPPVQTTNALSFY